MLEAVLYFIYLQLNIMSCAFVGGYLSVLAVDLWLQTGLHMIVLNSLRHATKAEFITDKVLVSGPFLWPGMYTFKDLHYRIGTTGTYSYCPL